ncbi:hypothetical protein EW146_g4440 [Bondarzewia mesenterica]|uniref:Protein kinase domain-containing protein n=1 Tax=Bondarzewia mesenterica TaxID=1095465 RepID=A0A4S4LV33_9AGAM|nr:hypothetical protein EW146_g4440 [Bondarzewia mesenterica]
MPVPSARIPDLTNCYVDNGTLLLTKCLGAGAFGVVYRAVDITSPPDNRKHYAVKCTMRAEPGTRHAVTQRNEITLHEKVSKHPNVITLHRVVEEDDFSFIIMDLCPSGDLFEAAVMRRVYANNDELLKLAFTQIIDAVEACHGKNVFHRDLKPDNILASSDGSQIWLTDFGLSTSKSTSNEFYVGTPSYMSPECLGRVRPRNTYLSRNNDVWALGVILFMMITHHSPWERAHTEDALYQQFLCEDSFLPKYSMSREANDLLLSIFTLDSLYRISLSKLRAEIQSIPTFFAGSQTPVAGGKAPVPLSTGNVETSVRCQSILLDADVFALFSMSISCASPPSSWGSSPTIYTSASSSSAFLSWSDSDSDWESEGPITPETHPVQPANDVPDLPEGKNLGMKSVREAREPAHPLVANRQGSLEDIEL